MNITVTFNPDTHKTLCAILVRFLQLCANNKCIGENSMATIRDLGKNTPDSSVNHDFRVLNNDPTLNVTDNTRVSILEAADELHYTLPKQDVPIKPPRPYRHR